MCFLPRSILTGIINEDEFPRGKVLSEDSGERAGDVGRGVTGRAEDREEGLSSSCHGVPRMCSLLQRAKLAFTPSGTSPKRSHVSRMRFPQSNCAAESIRQSLSGFERLIQ